MPTYLTGIRRSGLLSQPPELLLVEQRNALPLGAQPLDLHQLDAAVLARRLQRVRPSADDHRRFRRRPAVDDGPRALRRADRVDALAAEDAGERQVDAFQRAQRA